MVAEMVAETHRFPVMGVVLMWVGNSDTRPIPATPTGLAKPMNYPNYDSKRTITYVGQWNTIQVCHYIVFVFILYFCSITLIVETFFLYFICLCSLIIPL